MHSAINESDAQYSYTIILIMYSHKHEHYRLVRMLDGGNKYPDPHCGIRRRVSRGLDPCNYSIYFDDGYDSDDEVED